MIQDPRRKTCALCGGNMVYFAHWKMDLLEKERPVYVCMECDFVAEAKDLTKE